MVTLFNASGFAATLSPLTDHLTAQPAFAGSLNNVLAFGFNGKMASVPAGYTLQSVLVAGQGVTDTMHAWGDLLLQTGGKQRTAPTQDFQTAYLSYWTDNGAYYYYHTEAGKNYQQTMLDVKAYVLDQAQLPVRAFQFDSWWYYRGSGPNGGGVVLW